MCSYPVRQFPGVAFLLKHNMVGLTVLGTVEQQRCFLAGTISFLQATRLEMREERGMRLDCLPYR